MAHGLLLIGICLLVPQQDQRGSADQKLSLKSCPSITGGDYAPDLALKAANQVIALGEEQAYQYLHAEASKRMPENDPHRDERIVILATLIYRTEADPPIRRPHLGAPDVPYHSMDLKKDWPCFPLAFSNDVPFLLVSGYVLGGRPESGRKYLEHCKRSGVFRDRPFRIPFQMDAQAGLASLWKEPRWQAIKWKDRGRGWSYTFSEQAIRDRLSDQVGRIGASQQR